MGTPQGKLKQRETSTRFLRQLMCITFVLALSATAILTAALFALRSFELLDPSEYSTTHILLQAAIVGGLLPFLLCAMFWILTRESMDKWFERLGLVILFIVIPFMAVVALTRFILGR